MGVDRDFEATMREQVRGMRRTAWLLTGNHSDADDLVQETLLTAYRRWRKVAAAQEVGAYLNRMLINHYLSAQRRRRPQTVPIEQEGDLGSTTARGPASTIVDRDVLTTALRGLPVRERTAVVLRHYLQLSTPEIGEAMGIGPSSARSALSRGIRSLRHAIQDTEFDSTSRSE